MGDPIPFKVISRDGVEVNEEIVPDKTVVTDPVTMTEPAEKTNEKEGVDPDPKKDEKEPETAVHQTSGSSTETPEQPKEEKEKEKTPAANPEPPKETPDEIISKHVAEKTQGKFKSIDDLLAELSKPAQPKFKDDFIRKAVEYYDATGSLTPYLEAHSVDYSKLDDEAIMRMNLRKEYPKVSNAALERLYRERVIKKYNMDPEEDDPADIEIGKELMAADAAKLREEAIKHQQEFKIPEKPAEEQRTPNQPDPEAQKAQAKQVLDKVKADPSAKELLTNKRVVFKHDGSDFNFEVGNPENLVGMVADGDQFWKLFVSPDGKVDMDKFFRIAAIASDEETFMKSYVTHAKSIAKDEVLKKIKNTTRETGEAPKGDPAEGTKEGLIKAMAEKGRKVVI